MRGGVIRIFCDEEEDRGGVQEEGILVVGYEFINPGGHFKCIFHSKAVVKYLPYMLNPQRTWT